MGWLDVCSTGHMLHSAIMWLPWCVLFPLSLRRNSGVVWHRSYWFKYNVYMVVCVFFATYFHTEYFFEVLGIRYRFDQVTRYFDAVLVGQGEATAAQERKEVPPGMYLTATAFFVV